MEEMVSDEPCLTKYETRVFFDSVVGANLTYGSLIRVVGLSQEELFLWLPVKDTIVDDPKSGLILFDIGLAHSSSFSPSLSRRSASLQPQVRRIVSHKSVNLKAKLTSLGTSNPQQQC